MTSIVFAGGGRGGGVGRGAGLLSYKRTKARIDASTCEFITFLTRLHFPITEFGKCILVVWNTGIRHRMELSHR